MNIQLLFSSRSFFVVVAVSVGLIVGYIIDRYVITQLKKFAEKTTWTGDDIILDVLQGRILPFFLFAGFYTALIVSDLSQELVGLGNNIILVASITWGTYVIGQVVTELIKHHSQKAQSIIPETTILPILVGGLIYVVGGLVALQVLGISITPLLTALGVGGLAVALALQDTLTNLFAGIQLLLSQKLVPGDYIELESGQAGYVTDITWRNTTIRALQNNLIIIPNSKLSSVIITNFYQPERQLAVALTVGVNYTSDLDKVERVTIATAKEVIARVPGAVKEFEPTVRFTELGDFSINLVLGLRAHEYADQYVLKHECIKALVAAYRRENIDIPFPTQTIFSKPL